jgi:hypothetical protein
MYSRAEEGAGRIYVDKISVYVL